MQWLSQREHSRAELRRKLMPHAVLEQAAKQAEQEANADPAAQVGPTALLAPVAHLASAVPAGHVTPAGPAARMAPAVPAAHGGPIDRGEAAVSTDGSLGIGQDMVHSSPAARVDALLDWLEANRYLSNDRFVESRVHVRAGKYGNLRIRQELARHQLALPAGVAHALGTSEFERADAVRARKFAAWPADQAERAKQARFLAGRGFSLDVIGRLLRRRVDPDAGDDGTRERLGEFEEGP